MTSSGSSDITKSSEGSLGGKTKSKKRAAIYKERRKGRDDWEVITWHVAKKMYGQKASHIRKSRTLMTQSTFKSNTDKLAWQILDRGGMMRDADLSKDKSGPESPPEFWRSWYVEGHIKSGVISSVLAQRHLRNNPTKGPLTNGKAKVTWKVVSLPKDQGGLGIKYLKAWNEILLIKQLWKIVEDKESSWVKWVNVVKLKGTSICDIEISHRDSCGWKKLLGLRSNIKNHVFYSVGSGKNVSMWFDRWDIKGPLLDIIQRRVWYEERYTDNEKVADMIERGESDKVLWLDNQNEKKEFSTRQAWNDLRENVDKVEWHHVVWFLRFQPRQAFNLWLAILERLATQDRIKKWSGSSMMMYHLCNKEKDSHA
ncbi:RNA-directed DNA polymerase, eukaryota, reverse transcriptase zinc-binding domain protein [Tanacetum coccineum]